MHHLKMYLLLKMVIFQPVMLVFRKGNPNLFQSLQTSMSWSELAILLMATRSLARKPVEVGSWSQYSQGFSTIQGGWRWDFWTTNSTMVQKSPLFSTENLHRHSAFCICSCLAGKNRRLNALNRIKKYDGTFLGGQKTVQNSRFAIVFLLLFAPSSFPHSSRNGQICEHQKHNCEDV